MKNLNYLLILLFTSLGTLSYACRCDDILSFCEVTTSSSKVVEVEVVEKYNVGFEEYMDVKVIASLQGTVDEEYLTIASYGYSCDIAYQVFTIGERFVFKYENLEPANAISNYPNFEGAERCENIYLLLSGNEIYGRDIKPDVTSMNYDDFKNSIEECADLTYFHRDPDLEAYISINGNPTTGLTYIYTSSLDPDYHDISVEVYNFNGQLMTTVDRITERNYPLDLSQFTNGIYFLRIRFQEFSITKKVVKI